MSFSLIKYRSVRGDEEELENLAKLFCSTRGYSRRRHKFRFPEFQASAHDHKSWSDRALQGVVDRLGLIGPGPQ